MKRILLVLAIFLVIGATYVVITEVRLPKPELGDGGQATSSAEITKVTRIVDGDTIEIEGGRRIRYIGIDTPEINECFGTAATDENSLLVNGKAVRLVSDVSDTDTYGRLLRYVYVGNEFVNDTLVRQGFAVTEPVRPDILFASQFLSAQNEAKNSNRGLWRACNSSVDTTR